MAENSVHIFGIRHHGPGSARSLRKALEALKPDCVLVEGPPDAAGILPLLTHKEMSPPVAILVHDADDPKKAVYYPFAEFSPEWQALDYALRKKVPARFMDLPQAHRMGGDGEAEAAERPVLRRDPLGALAEAAGFSDGERWWEYMVEHRRDGADVFAAILEAMTALREKADIPEDPQDLRREAWMRQTIRAARDEGFGRIAVVCGAWHGPALATMLPAKDDADLLTALPKTKVEATWIPWTYSRLTFFSGYGAGIESPGWYDHLWHHPDQAVVRWMTRVARLFREQDLDCSSAHVIESVRLAESLAALRQRPLPGLPELNDAARAIFCFDSDLPMRLIAERLIVGDRLGEVPEETPAVPLQQDLAREQKRLRLKPEALEKAYDLDLRKETDLDRSRLLHRLGLLSVPWGRLERSGGGKGTFHEVWKLRWEPELSVKLIEAGVWGNTILGAATAFSRDAADKAQDLPAVTKLLDAVLLADLPEAVPHVMSRLEAQAAVASDVNHLMDALPPLANILRYGNVRQTDASMVSHAVNGLVARIVVGLPYACSSLNEDAAGEMFNRLLSTHSAISLLQNAEHTAAWYGVLRQLSDMQSLHGLVGGRATRLLVDADELTAEESGRRMSLSLSSGNDPAQSAAWVEGFLKGSGLLLLHDKALFGLLDSWLTGVPADTFTQLVPLLRRTFSTFDPNERQQIGQRVKQGGNVRQASSSSATTSTDIDLARAESVLPLLAQILGLPAPSSAKPKEPVA